MKILAPVFLAVICITANAQNFDSLQTKMLSPSAMLADFKYLRQLLVETHPGLYRYNTREAMQAKLDSSEQLLNKPMLFYRFYQVVVGLIADIHCAHTYALPVKNIEAFMGSKMKTLPFFLIPLQNNLYVLFNCTDNKTILPGAELLSINDRPIAEIKKTIQRYYWADGFNELAKDNALQGQLFYIFYYSFIEQPDSFHLVFKNPNGEVINFNTPAQIAAQFLRNIRKNELNKKMDLWYNRNKQKHPWRLTFPEDITGTAMLRLDAFGGEGARNEEEARSTFRAFMDKSLTEIEQKKCSNLIIDIRGNNGGWDVQGVEFFTYLMKSDTAIKYYNSQHTVTNNSSFLKFADVSEEDLKKAKDELKSNPDGTFSLQEEANLNLQLQHAKPNRFKGNVYILMDQKTFSTASEFTAVAKANKLAIFVGEETPGAYVGGNGGSFIHLELPNSKIAIGTPLVSYQMNVEEPIEKGRGTMPDYEVSVSIDDVLNHTYPQLAFVKELIKKREGNATKH